MILYTIFLFFLNLKYDYMVKSPFILFTITAYLIYILSSFYHMNSYPNWVSFEVSYLGAVFFSTLFFCRFLLDTILNNGKIVLNNNVDEVDLAYFSKILFILSLILLVLISYRFNFNIIKALMSDWAESRQTGGYIGLLSLYLYYVVSSLLLISILKKNKILILYTIFFSFLMTLIFKSRGYLLSVFLPVLLYYILYSNLSFKKYIYIFTGILGILFFYLFTRYIRWIGGIHNIEISNFNLKSILGNDSAELELISVLYDVILNNNYHQVVSEEFSSVQRILFIFIPDFLYTKPTDLSYVLWNYKTGILDIGGSYHPTVVAEAYFNHAQYGVFVYACLIAIFFSYFDMFLRASNKINFIFISGSLCFFIMALARGSSYNAFMVLLFAILCLLFFRYIRKVKL